MEMVFRKIEYWIEGDRNKQMKLDRQEWDSEKIRKRHLEISFFDEGTDREPSSA
jgi:hypothetical protein